MEATDLYQTTNTARDLVLTDLPEGPFVATTKVTAPINRQYQSAGLLVYGDDDNYLKHVFQGRSADPNAASNIIQTARETTGTAAETNTSGLGATFPSTVWLRLTSEDGEQVLGSYSTDGESWTDMAAGYSLAGITNPRIGLLSAANQAGGAGITASFDFFTLGEDETLRAGWRGAGRHHGTDDAVASRGHRPGRLVHHAAVVHPEPRRDGRVGHRHDRVPDRRRHDWTPYTAAVSRSTSEGPRLVSTARPTRRATGRPGRSSRGPDGQARTRPHGAGATLTIPAATGTDGWYTTRPSFTLAATDGADGSGIASIRVPHRRRRLDALHHRGPRDR